MDAGSVITCGTLNNPQNGNVNIVGAGADSLATYSCNSGFKLQGITQRICSISGSWSGIPPTCVGEDFFY